MIVEGKNVGFRLLTIAIDIIYVEPIDLVHPFIKVQVAGGIAKRLQDSFDHKVFPIARVTHTLVKLLIKEVVVYCHVQECRDAVPLVAGESITDEHPFEV